MIGSELVPFTGCGLTVTVVDRELSLGLPSPVLIVASAVIVMVPGVVPAVFQWKLRVVLSPALSETGCWPMLAPPAERDTVMLSGSNPLSFTRTVIVTLSPALTVVGVATTLVMATSVTIRVLNVPSFCCDTEMGPPGVSTHIPSGKGRLLKALEFTVKRIEANVPLPVNEGMTLPCASRLKATMTVPAAWFTWIIGTPCWLLRAACQKDPNDTPLKVVARIVGS